MRNEFLIGVTVFTSLVSAPSFGKRAGDHAATTGPLAPAAPFHRFQAPPESADPQPAHDYLINADDKGLKIVRFLKSSADKMFVAKTIAESKDPKKEDLDQAKANIKEVKEGLAKLINEALAVTEPKDADDPGVAEKGGDLTLNLKTFGDQLLLADKKNGKLFIVSTKTGQVTSLLAKNISAVVGNDDSLVVISKDKDSKGADTRTFRYFGKAAMGDDGHKGATQDGYEDVKREKNNGASFRINTVGALPQQSVSSMWKITNTGSTLVNYYIHREPAAFLELKEYGLSPAEDVFLQNK